MLNNSSTLDRTIQVVFFCINFKSFHVAPISSFLDCFQDLECSGRCWIVASCLVNSSSTKEAILTTTALDTSKGRYEISTEILQKILPSFEQKSEDPLLLYNSAATITLTTAKEESCNKRCQRPVD